MHIINFVTKDLKSYTLLTITGLAGKHARCPSTEGILLAFKECLISPLSYPIQGYFENLQTVHCCLPSLVSTPKHNVPLMFT